MGMPAWHGPPCATVTLLCMSFLGKSTEACCEWRHKGWRSGQKCWVSKLCRLDMNDERSEGEARVQA